MISVRPPAVAGLFYPAVAAELRRDVETMLAAGLRLVHAGDVTLPRLLAALSSTPAKILGLPQGRLQKDAPADLIVFDPDTPFRSEEHTSELQSH